MYIKPRRRLIRGKFDSRWKFGWDERANRTSKVLTQGYFMGAMAYARYTQGGVKMIEHVRTRPWDTWRGRYN